MWVVFCGGRSFSVLLLKIKVLLRIFTNAICWVLIG